MSNEIVQPTEQHLSRSTSTQAAKASKPPALNVSSFTNSPTRSTSTAQDTATTEDSDTTALSGSQLEKDSLKVADEALEVPKKTRSLLQVPSRSSSQNIQPSPTSTGLSGATVSDSRDSIGGKSKESKGSTLGRRNGSVASSRMSITQQGVSVGQAGTAKIPSNPTASRQPKKKGIFSFLCCGVPDGANALDPNDAAVPANKVTKAPSTRPITASRPDPGTSTHSNSTPSKSTTEKEPFREGAGTQAELNDGVNANNSVRNSQTGTNTLPGVDGDVNEPEAVAREPSLPEQPKATESASVEKAVGSNPAVVPQGLSRSESTVTPAPEVQEQIDPDGDVIMANSEPVLADKEENPVSVARQAETVKETSLPPPPPVPLAHAEPSDSPPGPEPAEEKQQWLLPPISSRFQGKKCLVLDLDETLVHSSFKILHQADFTIPVEIEGQYHNVYVIKRPGVDQFMKRVGELYEVVVFTASVSKYGDPLLDQLDIHHVVHHRLFRESCYNHQGNYVKDLSQVGRDLRETIIIDNSPTSYIFHPQHAVPISSWFSDAHDNELLDLIPVLEDLAGPQVRDVSLVLDVAL
ncbi:hypothetical protein QTJ16_003433 [Diplocarpon rosae]|uniref:FCP1 homology domain-containing protein n=1 Tax=Diplocarpon rosae TaxID=946125 RepID=A0AAD9WDE1_9HELO|nr:hypothetical protein QTJ16_003433 [Diplocarpon rosae]